MTTPTAPTEPGQRGDQVMPLINAIATTLEHDPWIQAALLVISDRPTFTEADYRLAAAWAVYGLMGRTRPTRPARPT